MTKDAREKDAGSSASSAAQRWAARRKEVNAAIELDQKRVLQARMEKEYRARVEHRGSPAGMIIAGALVVFVLLTACWFIIDRMRCDPFYANIDRFSFRACE